MLKFLDLIPVINSRPARDTSARRQMLRNLLIAEFNLREQELRDHFEADVQKLRDETSAKILQSW